MNLLLIRSQSAVLMPCTPAAPYTCGPSTMSVWGWGVRPVPGEWLNNGGGGKGFLGHLVGSSATVMLEV